jgi:DMSO/TMAO reductase YedYZ molybdopterin-dependent catalytic subunit
MSKLAGILFVSLILLVTGCLENQSEDSKVFSEAQESASSKLSEIEFHEYKGFNLTPLDEQKNNGISGTQYINRTTYRLKVTGLVNHELEMSYNELLELPFYSKLAYMPCVEGWGFTAKWTGFRLTDLFNLSDPKQEAKYVSFNSIDGYSTSLPLDYIKEKRIIAACGINDLTLPPDRGFPFQIVAEGKYGYKWAKWITSIELVEKDVPGYWESRGYGNLANVGDPPFE